MWDLAFFTLFLVVFILPFLPAINEWLSKKDATALWRVSTNDEIRHFADRFKVFAEKELSLAYINDSYRIIMPEDESSLNQNEEFIRTIAKKVYLPEEMHMPDQYIYTQEIYAKNNVSFGRNSNIYAALVLGNLEVGDGSIVNRWLHANTIEVGDCCRLLGRVSAEEKIEIQPSSRFSRLHAPRIEFGALNDIDRDYFSTILERGVSADNLGKLQLTADSAGRCIINGDFEIPENSLVSSDLIVRGNLKINRGSVVSGNVKTYGFTSLAAYVSIKGSMVSQSDIFVSNWCNLHGPVISEGNIKLSDGTTVGSVYKPSTVTAQQFESAHNVLVYGTINIRSPETNILFS